MTRPPLRVVLLLVRRGFHCPAIARIHDVAVPDARPQSWQEQNRGPGNQTMQGYGTYLALRTGVNLAKQYWPTIFKSLTQAKQQKKRGGP